MEVTQVLRMNGGIGAKSYANNSLVQKKVISMTKPIREEAITSLYESILSTSTRIVIADLGCSSGPNTLLVVSEIIDTIEKTHSEMGHRKSPLEYQVFLNDLPGNDFNTIFRSLHEKFSTRQLGSCFVAGVPGSFYGRLFLSNSLHFVHSSYSLQWLSQVPEELGSNKGNIYIASTSPKNVLEAYYEQFQRDFSMFLKCRSDELVEGGRMVLTILGRRSDDPSSKECSYIWELLAMALNEMVSEGVIKEEEVNTFNIPQYTPSPEEVKLEVEREGSFVVERLEVSEIHWYVNNDDFFYPRATIKDGGYNVAQCMRAVAEPLLVSHFGEAIIEDVFCKYSKIVGDRMSKEKTEFINVTVSLTRKRIANMT